ncbi:MAG: rhomboid family intramembrane serine protease [Acidobacteria bacterium]|nr:rhomboid family intramembrane serine protease [Acidobacteriota bacterium]
MLVGVKDDRCYNCGRVNPGLWGFAPLLRSLGRDMGFVPFVIGTCVLVYILELIASGGAINTRGALSFLSPSLEASFLFGASGSVPVFQLGRWWTPLSAGWLHGGVLHILFNMMALRQLAPATAELYGPGRMVIVYTAGSVFGFFLSSFAGEYLPNILFLRGSPFTVGASAGIAGLIGAILYYGQRSGSSMTRTFATNYVLMLVVMGFFMQGVDNYAHLGGFAGGYVASRVLDPLKPERIDHIAIALACLAASMLAIIASVLHGMRILGS